MILRGSKGNEAANMVGIAGSMCPLVISWCMAHPTIAIVTDCPNSFPTKWCPIVVFVGWSIHLVNYRVII